MAPPRLKAIRQSALGLSEPQYPPQPLSKYWPVHPVAGSCSTNRAFEATAPSTLQKAGPDSLAATSDAEAMRTEASGRLEKSWAASSLHGTAAAMATDAEPGVAPVAGVASSVWAAAVGSTALPATNRLRSTRYAIRTGRNLVMVEGPRSIVRRRYACRHAAQERAAAAPRPTHLLYQDLWGHECECSRPRAAGSDEVGYPLRACCAEHDSRNRLHKSFSAADNVTTGMAVTGLE